MSAAVTTYRFTVEEYYRMAETGIFKPDDGVELIRGEIIAMSAVGRFHAAHVNRLNALLSQTLGNRAVTSVQNPVRINEYSEPEPDLAVLRPQEDYYAAGHPGPADVLLLIEVADSSYEYDRDVKVPLYAEAGIPEVWLLNVAGPELTIYRRPADGRYTEVLRPQPDNTLTPIRLPNVSFTHQEIAGAF
ncbi:MAG: Uma2 family endonuclease [Catalinimonas sp.]